MEYIEIENKTKNEIPNKVVSCTLEEKVVDAAFKEEASIILNKELANIVVKEEIPEKLANIYSRIIRELRDFFSDSNLVCDRYLQKVLQFDDGWVRISLLSTFRTIKSISQESDIIAAAVKNDTDSILEVDETNEKIRRKPDSAVSVYNQKFINELIKRSVYCKGFPKTASIYDIFEFAAGLGHENITNVILRKVFVTGAFKGSIYLTFISKEQADNFLKQKSVKYNGVELQRKWEIDFLEEKSKAFFERSQKKKAKIENYFKKGYLIKADILNETITLKSIQTICKGFNWQVVFIKFVEDQKIAWIRLKPGKIAKDLLNEISNKTNDPNIVFSLPEEVIEQSVLKEMYTNMT